MSQRLSVKDLKRQAGIHHDVANLLEEPRVLAVHIADLQFVVVPHDLQIGTELCDAGLKPQGNPETEQRLLGIEPRGHELQRP